MVQTAQRTGGQAPAKPGSRDDLVIVAIGLWMVAAGYWDGWSHLTNKPESILSPPHVMLYVGFGAAAAYFGYRDARSRRDGLPGVDRLGVLGLGLFFFSTVGDFAWHSIFGFEGGLELLLSPSHLGLLASGALIFTTPLRSAWRSLDDPAPGLRAFLAPLASITIAAMAVSFMTAYVSGFILPGLVVHSNAAIQFLHYIQGIAAVVLTNAILIVPTLILLQRWRPPLGSFVFLYTATAFGMAAMQSMRWSRLIYAGIAGGLAADLIVWLLRRRSARLRARAVGAFVPLVMWGVWALAANTIEGIEWSADMLGGTIALASLSGLVLSVLAFPIAVPQPAPARPPVPVSPPD